MPLKLRAKSLRDALGSPLPEAPGADALAEPDAPLPEAEGTAAESEPDWAAVAEAVPEAGPSPLGVGAATPEPLLEAATMAGYRQSGCTKVTQGYDTYGNRTETAEEPKLPEYQLYRTSSSKG